LTGVKLKGTRNEHVQNSLTVNYMYIFSIYIF